MDYDCKIRSYYFICPQRHSEPALEGPIHRELRSILYKLPGFEARDSWIQGVTPTLVHRNLALSASDGIAYFNRCALLTSLVENSFEKRSCQSAFGITRQVTSYCLLTLNKISVSWCVRQV